MEGPIEFIKATDHEGFIEPRQIIMNDDCVLAILKNLNFNDKASCRLVSRQFIRSVDSLPILKLVSLSFLISFNCLCSLIQSKFTSLQVVFDRSPILPGKFSLINEEYNLQDCVYVCNLEKFFTNNFILQRLEKIEKLVINGLEEKEFSLNATFNKLTHLELRKACIINSTVMKSPNIKTLFLHDTYLNKTAEDYFNGALGFNNLKCQLKHFSHSTVLLKEIEFYQTCFKKGVFSELEILDCYLNELKTFVYISTHFTQLKTLNVRIAKSRDDFIDLLEHNALGTLVKKLRSDLNVNVFGIPLNKSTHKVIEDVILQSEFTFAPGRIGVLINPEWIEYQIDTEDKHPHLLDGFFKQIDTIRFEDALTDKSVYNKLTNVSEASYRFWLEVRHDLPERFKAHPNITCLILSSFPDGHYLNDIVDTIPFNFKNLTELAMDQWDDVNFDFLLTLSKLKTLRLYLRFAFDQSLFVEMLRNLKHLSFVEIFYERTNLHTKDELSSFKKMVQACISNELRYTDCVFKIELHHRTSYMGNEKFSFVRYILKRIWLDPERNSLSACEDDIKKMMWCIGYKRTHPESSLEHDTMDNIYCQKK